ncbi:MAG: FAD-dependent oxidoreductase [Myxococcaceae bacterium]
MEQVETLIVGGGISGLATAAALGPNANVRVLEADSEIGGYCKTVKQNGFVWDYSGHFFHFKHPEIEAWLRARMAKQKVLTVARKSFIHIDGRQIDFPFQKNIHQLPQADFIDCLYGLWAATKEGAKHDESSFKKMLFARYGAGISQRFLIPYNEKLYATDLDTLDRDAMGRFFPHARLDDVIRNMKEPDNAGYNASFTYPEGGAIEYVKALASATDPSKVSLSEPVTRIDLAQRVAHTPKRTFKFERLVSSAPFNVLLKLCALPHDDAAFSWNQVLVFNLGFDRKGPTEPHWVYFPSKKTPFYRVGFYDNIFGSDRMSLYVELGYGKDAKIDVDDARAAVLEGLKAEGLVKDHELIAEHHVVMNPAYVHITQASMKAVAEAKASLAKNGVHSIGRYGGWTYCSIEDNMIEARELVKSWTGRDTPLHKSLS